MILRDVDGRLAGTEGRWSFVGAPGWREDHEGIIYPPVWSNPRFDPDPSKIPDYYAHELAREDFAFLAAEPLADTDVSVELKCPYGSVIHGGLVLRAPDSSRFYVLDIIDMGRKAQNYELTLWVQEQSGFRRELAKGRAPHSIVSEAILQRGPKTRVEWYHSTPDWFEVRVQASGGYFRVSADGVIVFDVRDGSYPAGRVGLAARGAVFFRRFSVKGTAAETALPWAAHAGEIPRFFLPGGRQPEGFNAYPAACVTASGAISVCWSHAPLQSDPWAKKRIMMTSSSDAGKSWTAPSEIFASPEGNCVPNTLFAHRSEEMSCIVQVYREDGTKETRVIRSADGGATWTVGGELTVGGRRLADNEHLYSPMVRLAGGAVVMCGYTARGEENAARMDQSFLLMSHDDGVSFGAPRVIDPGNSDHNECAVAEFSQGRLVAFMRTLRAPYMWTSVSEDGGKTWTPLVQSTIMAECPILLRHSGGALLLASRGCGTFLAISRDGGETWAARSRISPASAMMGMVEMPDGRIFIVMHEGYRVPGHIRAQFFDVTDAGPVPA